MSKLYYFVKIEQQSLDIRITEELLDDQEITQEKHNQLFIALNNQCVILDDLTISEPRPSSHHVWDGANWIDKRTEEEKYATYLTQFTPLTRRQFKLSLLENGLLDTVEQMIGAIEDPALKSRIQIEYNESERFERTNESVQYMLGVLDLTSDQVDEMWRYAITL